jgi:hypothetical protein
MNVLSKEEAESLLDSLEINLERLVRLSELIPEPDDQQNMKNIIEQISQIAYKYLT